MSSTLFDLQGNNMDMAISFQFTTAINGDVSGGEVAFEPALDPIEFSDLQKRWNSLG